MCKERSYLRNTLAIMHPDRRGDGSEAVVEVVGVTSAISLILAGAQLSATHYMVIFAIRRKAPCEALVPLEGLRSHNASYVRYLVRYPTYHKYVCSMIALNLLYRLS